MRADERADRAETIAETLVVEEAEVTKQRTRLGKGAAASIVAMVGILVWGILEVDERRDIGDLKRVVDPCVEHPRSDACAARTCVRLDNVDGNERKLSGHLRRFFPECPDLLRRVRFGDLVPAPPLVTDGGESVGTTGGGGRGEGGTNPGGPAPPGGSPPPGGTGGGTDDDPAVSVPLPDPIPSLCLPDVGGVNC